MNRIFYKSLVSSNVWVALAVVSLCYLTLAPHLLLPTAFFAFVFFATVAAYSYMRIVHLRKISIRHWSLESSNHRTAVFLELALILVAGCATLYLLFEIYQPGLLSFIALPLFIAFIYPISFPNPYSNFTSPRLLPGLKLFLISFTWSYITVLLPEFLYGELSSQIYGEFTFRIILIASLVIPFDIRDLKHDNDRMRTLPQVLGYKSAREVALFGLLIYQLWLLFKVLIFNLSLPSAVVQLLAFEVGAILISRVNPSRSDAYFSFWIEAIPIYVAAALFIMLSLI